MPFYPEMADMVTDLLQPDAQGGLGQGTITLTRQLPPVVNEAGTWLEPVEQDPVTWTLSGAATGVDKEFVDGSAILATDKQIIAAVFEDEPRPGDTVSIDGAPVTLLRIDRIPAAGSVVAWRLFTRG